MQYSRFCNIVSRESDNQLELFPLEFLYSVFFLKQLIFILLARWCSELHIFIQLTLNSGSALVQLVTCCGCGCGSLDLWQFFRLEIRLNAFRRSTIPQKQFFIIIITIIIIIIIIIITYTCTKNLYSKCTSINNINEKLNPQ